MPARNTLLIVLALAICACALALWLLRNSDETQASVLPGAHAHNDYQHAQPLLDALDHGFTSVEADVWLIDGTLLVAHDREQASAERSLEALYLQPLEERVRRGHGYVFAAWPHSLQLLIDIKSDAEPSYLALHTVLAAHSSMLTTFSRAHVEHAAVSIVVSGNRTRALMLSQELRYAAYDGRLSELREGLSAAFMPLVSDNWSDQFTWNGTGLQPEAERVKLQQIVRQAHAQGRRLRFWGTPETAPARESVWLQLRAAGVDYINTDDLGGLQAWLPRH
jgi:glycerophosphoryl diester phosphodiesterase